MEDTPLPPGHTVSPLAAASLEGTETNKPVSSFVAASTQYPLETLEVHPQDSAQSAAISVATVRSVPFSRRRAIIVSLAITLLVLLLTAASMAFILRREASERESQLSVPAQDIVVGDSSEPLVGLEGVDEALLVNGDIIARGEVKVVSGDFTNTIETDELTDDQVLTLPNASGTFCLDSNNCSFATQTQLATETAQTSELAADLAALQTQLDEIAAAGVSALNGQAGALTIQGTANQISVATANGVITLLTPQDLAPASSPTFAGLQLNGDLNVTGTVDLPLNCSGFVNTGKLTTNSSGQIICGDDVGGGGGGAPANANYLVTSLDGTLTNERAFAVNTTNLTATDGGANGSYTLNTVQNIATTSSPTFAGLTLNGNLSLGANSIQGTTAAIDFTNFDVSSAGAVTAVGVNAGSGLLQGTGGLTVGGTITLSSLTNGFLEVNGSGVVSVGTINLGTDTVGDYVANLGTLTGLNTTGNSGEGSTPTLSVIYGSAANTAVQGNTGITVTAGTNLTGGGSITLGAGGSVTLDVASSPTFAGDVVIQGGDLTVGTATQVANLVLHDGDAETISLTLPDVSTSYTLTLPTAVGAANQCLKAQNGTGTLFWDTCLGGGGGGVTGTGTNNRVAKFTSTGSTIGDSTISDDGTNVSITGDFTLQGGDITVGTTSQLGSLVLHDGNGQTATLRGGDSSGNLVFILPTAAGATNQCIKQSGTANQLVFDNCDGGGGGSSATLQQAYNNGNTIATTSARDIAFTLSNDATDSNFVVTIADDSTSTVQIVRANGTGTNNPAQLMLLDNLDINQVIADGLRIQSAGGGITDAIDLSDAELVNALNLGDNNVVGTTTVIDFTNFDVAGNGNTSIGGTLAVTGTVTGGTYNGQTITNAASFTGSLSVATTAGIGTTATSSILTVQGSAGQSEIYIQGNSEANIAADGSLYLGFDANNDCGICEFAIYNDGTTEVFGITGSDARVRGSITSGTAALQGSLVLNDGNGQTATISVGSALAANTALAIPTTVGASDTFCLLTLGNCFGSGTGNTLQAAYNAGNTITTTNARDIDITLDNTATDPSFLIDIASGSTGRFAVQGNGTDILNVTPTGIAIVSESSGSRVISGRFNYDTSGIGATTYFQTSEVDDDTLLSVVANGTADTSGLVLYGNGLGGSHGIVEYTSDIALNIVATNELSNGGGSINLITKPGGGGSETTRLTITQDGVTTFNPTGTDSDFSIQGDTNANLFYVDAGADRIGIGDATPAATFTVGSGDLFQVAGATGNVTTAGDIVASGGDVTVGTVSQQGSLVLHDGNGQTATISVGSALAANTALAIPTTVGASDTFCLLTLGNCFGSGTGNTLQAAYDAGNTISTSDNRNIAFTLADTTTDSDFIVNMQGTGNIIQFQDSGTPFFTAIDGGSIGIGTATPDGRLEIAGNMSQAAWGLNGIQLQASSATYTDTGTAGTRTNTVINSFGQPTIASTNAVISTNAATVYVQNAPAAGTNHTISNAYALWVDDGNARFDGSVGINTTTPAGSLQVVGRDNTSGTGTISSSGDTVTGSGTFFTREVTVGTVIIAAGQQRTVIDIASNTTLTTDSAFSPALSGEGFTYRQPIATFTQPGNPDGENTNLLYVDREDGNPAFGLNYNFAWFGGGNGVDADNWQTFAPAGAFVAIGYAGGGNSGFISGNANALFLIEPKSSGGSVGIDVGTGTIVTRNQTKAVGLNETPPDSDEAIHLRQTIPLATTVGYRLRAASGQTADLIQATTNAGGALFNLTAGGNLGLSDATPDGRLDVELASTSTTAATERGISLTVSDTGTDTTYGQQMSVTRTGATGGTINTTGLDISVTGDAGGTSTVTGLNVNVTGADTNYAAIFQGGNVGVGDTTPDALLDVAGSFQFDGNGVFGDASSDTVTFNAEVASHIIPDVDDTYDLGSATNRWRDLYLGPASLHVGTNGDEGTISYNTGTNTFQFSQAISTPTFRSDTATFGVASTTNGVLTLQNATNAFTVSINAPDQTVGSATISLPDTAGVNDEFCLLALNNCGSAGGVTTIGTIDSQTKSANGAVISGTSLVLQTADVTFPGLVNTGTQTFAGAKTFNGAVTAAAAGTGLSVTNNASVGGNLAVTGTGTFTGDVAVNGGDLTATGALNITPSGTLTLGVTGQAAILQGSTTSITSNGAGSDITLTSADEIVINSTGATVVNEPGSAVNFRVESDTNANMLFVDGTNNRVGIGNATPGAALEVTGDIYLTKEVARTIKLADTTTDSTAGAALSILGANGGNEANGGAITIQAGTAGTTATSRLGGNVTVKGGTSQGFSIGGHVDLVGGEGLQGGLVRINGGAGIIRGDILLQNDEPNGSVGIGIADADGRLHLGGNMTHAAWGLNGINLRADSATYTDSDGAGTRTNTVVNSFGRPTFASTNAVTSTNAATVYIQNSPLASGNHSITNAYSLWVDDGTVRLDGTLDAQGGTVTNSAGALSLTSATTNAITLDSGTTGTVNVGTSANAKTINLGTGAAVANTINIGGTGANVIAMGNTQTAGSIAMGAAMTTGTITIGGTGAQTGTITFGGGTGAQTVNLGTGSTGVKTVNLATGTAANVISIATGQTAGSISMGTAMTTGTISIGGTGAQTGTITFGGGTGAQTVNLGTGGTGVKTVNLGTGTAANVISIGTGQTAGSISMGTAMTTGTISIGGTGAQTGTISLGTGTGTQTINLATGAGAKTVTVGSLTGASTTTIRGGPSGEIRLATDGTNRLIVQSDGDVELGPGSDPVALVDVTNRRLGVGTASPASQLHVQQSVQGAVEGFRLQDSDSGRAFEFYYDTGSAAMALIGGSYQLGHNAAVAETGQLGAGTTLTLKSFNDSGSGAIIFDMNGTEMGRFTNTGNLGIGDATPDGRLDVELASTSTTAGTERGTSLTVSDTGVVTTGTDTTLGEQISVTRTGATGGTINTTGLDISVTGDAGGTSTAIGLNVNVTAADTNYAAIFQGGNVGIGTTAPTSTLDVAGSIETDLTASTNNFALCHENNGASNNEVIKDCSGTPSADYMEMYSVDQNVETGDIVAPGGEYITTKTGQRLKKLVKSSSAYQRSVIGIASNPDEAGDFNSIGHNIKDQDRPYPVALNGRVVVKISQSSPALEPGDYITTSGEAGKATKATQPGLVIGKVLEEWTPGSGQATVLTFVNLSWYDPADSNDLQGNDDYVSNGDNASFATLNVSGATTLASLTVTGNAVIEGELTVTNVHVTQRLVVDGHIVTGNSSGTTTASPGAASCSGTVTVSGNDTAGTITIQTGAGGCAPGVLAAVDFATDFTTAPRVILTPANAGSAAVGYFAGTTNNTSFTIDAANAPSNSATYIYNYHVLQ